VSRQDQALVSQVQELRDRVAKEHSDLQTVQRELARNRDERSQELTRYADLERQRQQSLSETRSSAQQARERITALQRSEEQIDGVIAELERRRREALASGRLPSLAASITRKSLGSLAWPVSGPVVYRFGPSSGPNGTSVQYQGIGIGTPLGTPVHVVAGGRVASAGPQGTFGLTIVVEHGGGFYTVYAYLSRLEVTTGQLLRAGDVVGLSGGAASDHGPHIEFQIREATDGNQPVALDPLNWLTRNP
jgi:murein hydrolase activator